MKYLYQIIVALIVFIALVIFIGTSGRWGVNLYSVKSSSMSPSIPRGSLVLINATGRYSAGDVITYMFEGRPDQTITHRIVEVREENGERRYVTKGDANEDPDGESVPAGDVIGKVAWHAPLLGYPVSAAKTKQGFIVMIVIPATIIVYSEIMAIKKEVLDKIEKRKKAKKEITNEALNESQ